MSTTRRIKSDGLICLMTPSSPLDAPPFSAELKPEARLKAATKSASHHVTILIAANEACRGKSSLPPLMRMQRGSLRTVCIPCAESRDIGDGGCKFINNAARELTRFDQSVPVESLNFDLKQMSSKCRCRDTR